MCSRITKPMNFSMAITFLAVGEEVPVYQYAPIIDIRVVISENIVKKHPPFSPLTSFRTEKTSR